MVQEDTNIVIVGGGIAGLAMALALHRKGIKSVVLEKSKTLRATGAAIIVQPNGWHALDQLGIAQNLRLMAVPILSCKTISVQDGKQRDIALGNGEMRCLKRMDLITCLAQNLPLGTVRYRCNVLSINMDRPNCPVLQLDDGSRVTAKVVIGCDGVNSVTATDLGLNPTKILSTCVTRGFTVYQNDHLFGNKFMIWTKSQVQLGLLPITTNLVYWFVTRPLNSRDSAISREQELIKESTMLSVEGFPAKLIELVENSQVESLNHTSLSYRSPWDLLVANFRRGTVTLAGDAMHAMGPFLAQGGSASLEDAVVLARCLSGKLNGKKEAIEEALDEYLKIRKMRLFWLSLQTHLVGTAIDTNSTLVKFFTFLILLIVFIDVNGHTQYDCGTL